MHLIVSIFCLNYLSSSQGSRSTVQINPGAGQKVSLVICVICRFSFSSRSLPWEPLIPLNFALLEDFLVSHVCLDLC